MPILYIEKKNRKSHFARAGLRTLGRHSFAHLYQKRCEREREIEPIRLRFRGLNLQWSKTQTKRREKSNVLFYVEVVGNENRKTHIFRFDMCERTKNSKKPILCRRTAIKSTSKNPSYSSCSPFTPSLDVCMSERRSDNRQNNRCRLCNSVTIQIKTIKGKT